jgi:serine/threonine protein kinase
MIMEIYQPGTMIGQYEVVSKPMMGGMGVVYFCLYHGNNKKKPVALKTFKPEFLPDLKARGRFLREGTIWMKLGKHPNVVQCYGIERIGDGTKIFLVLELVGNVFGHADASLRSMLKTGKPLPVDSALLLALQITRGIRHAVDTIPGFVHRDLKPENILVGIDYLNGTGVNHAYVTDFGLASVVQDNPNIQFPADSGQWSRDNPYRIQITHGIIGTPPYMAPEQWAGEGLTIQTDMYALGCIIYEMITSQSVVSGSSLEALKQEHQKEKSLVLMADKPEIVTDVVKRCLAVNLSDRYENWIGVEQALCRAYQTLTKEPVPEMERPREMDRAEQIALGGALCTIGFIVFGHRQSSHGDGILRTSIVYRCARKK